MRRYSSLFFTAAIAAFTVTAFSAQPTGASIGVRDPAWSPDGRRIAVSWLDEIWTMTPDGRDERRVVTTRGDWVGERDPAYSPDGRSIAFAADTAGAYDLYVVSASGGAARKVVSLDGDERWPSWTLDGRLVFSHRAPQGRWQVHVVAADGSDSPVKVTPDTSAEWQARVSSDGRRLVFVSDRDLEPGDSADIFVRELSAAGDAARPIRVTRGGGEEQFPVWAPDNQRVS
jgi:Tol biopolymer transport system component